jgi:glucosamine--fructose-6-phosphate aminotransferase (isomerizing)
MPKEVSATTPTSHYLSDWYGQPQSLIQSATALDDQWPDIKTAAEWLRRRPVLLIAGVGASYNAGLALEAFMAQRGRLARVIDASELAYDDYPIPDGVGVVAASRSGESIEVVKLAERCQRLNVPLVAVTNSPNSPLAQAATWVVELRTDFDYLISLRMYTAIVQGLLALGLAICQPETDFPLAALTQIWEAAADRLDAWRAAVRESDFFGADRVYYNLARSESWASANAGRLLFEECGKTNATALTTGNFRHGPQESLSAGFRAIIWLPTASPFRKYDLALAESIQQASGRCLIIGNNMTQDTFSDLTLTLPPIEPLFRPVIDIVPLQIGVYEHARATGKNPDTLLYCPYVVKTEGGL